MAITLPIKNDLNWDVSLNAALTGLQTQADANTTSISSVSTRVTTLEGIDTFRESDHALMSWSFDPAVASGNTATVAGTVYLIKVNLRNGGTITNIVATVAVAGSTLTSSQNFAGLYSSSGTRLGITADQSASWTSIGTKTMAIAGGALALTAGSYYVALLSNGTTPPQFQRSGNTANPSASMLNVGLTAATGRFITTETSQTSLPSTTNLVSNAVTDSAARWVALS